MKHSISSKNILSWIRSPFSLALIGFVIITTLLTFQSVKLGSKNFGTNTEYTHYNNYKIFKASYFHLIDNKDLYSEHPAEHFDYYKYSPTFPVLMAPMAYLPDFLGLLIWNLLNVIPLFIGVWLFPGLTRPKRLFFLLMVLVELITAVQNSQSNGLIAGLMLLAFVFLERNKPGYAALFILLTAFIKVFGIIACVLFIFYPGKFKSFAYLAICGIVLVVSPMLFVSPNQLVFLYKSWFQLMANDHSASLGLSVAGWIDAWFNIQPSKNMIVLVGFVMLCIPLLRVKQYNNPLFKKLFLASILTWIVIFNHKAESPTFVIAVTGIGIWYFAKKRPWFDFALLIAVVIFTELASTDLFPKSAKESFLSPFVIKVVPCILVWLKIIYEQIRLKNHSMDNQIQAE